MDARLEVERVAALHRYSILDTPPEESFDRITRVAMSALGVPVALVSLVDRDRQWFKSSHGLEVRETPREVSFCSHAIERDGVMIVPDALKDPRFSESPLVRGEPFIRFYAGMPLETRDGFKIGTLCAIDRVPRTMNDRQRALLEDLAGLVMDEMELRRQSMTEGMTGARTTASLMAELALAVHIAERDVSPLGLLRIGISSHGEDLTGPERRLSNDAVLQMLAATCDQALPRSAVVVRASASQLALILPRTELGTVQKFGAQLVDLYKARLARQGLEDIQDLIECASFSRGNGETADDMLAKLRT